MGYLLLLVTQSAVAVANKQMKFIVKLKLNGVETETVSISPSIENVLAGTIAYGR